MQKISSCLWFDGQAEEAANFYVSIFENSRIDTVTHYGPAAAAASGRPEGSIMTVTFQLEGQDFMALNGGPEFKFSEAVSFMVICETQQEVDSFWQKLSAGGEEGPCGWLKDKFGLSWQVVPRVMDEMLAEGDPGKTERVMQAMLQMKKLDIGALQAAYRG
jgi:predicted 3-demethylubiquinone-9 3-methyltransferase (glyoxalase superfamily)